AGRAGLPDVAGRARRQPDVGRPARPAGLMYAGISSAYLPTISNGGQYTVRCDAYRDGALIPGGRDLTIFSGSVTDESRPGVRRQLDVELLPEPGETVQHLFDLLAPTGTELRVRSILRNTGDVVPMGRFDVAAQKMGYGSQGTLSLQADDKWVK